MEGAFLVKEGVKEENVLCEIPNHPWPRLGGKTERRSADFSNL